MIMEEGSRNQHNPLMQTFGRDLQLQLNTTQEEPAEPVNAQDRASREKGRMHLKNIDEINDKINGLIRSISQSCKQQQRKRSAVKPNSRVEGKQDEAKAGKDLWHTDSKQTQKKKYSVNHPTSAISKPSMFSTQQQLPESVSKRLKHRRLHSVQGQEQDEISQRIQKINDKINKYGKKIGFNFTSQATNKHIKPNNKENVGSQKKPDSKVQKQKYIKDITQTVKHKTNSIKQNVSYNTLKESKMQKVKRKQSKVHINRDEYIQHCGTDRIKDSFSSIYINTPMPAPITINHVKTKPALLQALAKQIALDHTFRTSKHMYGGICDLFTTGNQHHDRKWKALQEELKEEGQEMGISQVREIFMPRDDEVDPFMSVSHSHDEALHSLVRAYTDAETHWKEVIYRSWTLHEFKEVGFSQESLDRGRKGFLTVQDLVSYLNTHLDGDYRNRDVVLLFNRLCGGSSSGSRVRFKNIADQLLNI